MTAQSNHFLFGTVLLLGTVTIAGAQTRPHKPSANERKEILNAVRPSVERTLGIKVVFVVATIVEVGDWSFARLIPKTSDGLSIDFSRTLVAQEVEGGSFGAGMNSDFDALAKRRNGKWVSVYTNLGASDYTTTSELVKHYGCPRSLFGSRR